MKRITVKIDLDVAPENIQSEVIQQIIGSNEQDFLTDLHDEIAGATVTITVKNRRVWHKKVIPNNLLSKDHKKD